MNRNVVSIVLIALILMAGAWSQSQASVGEEGVVMVEEDVLQAGSTMYDIVGNGKNINRYKVEQCLPVIQPVILPGAPSGSYNNLHVAIQGITQTVDAWSVDGVGRGITVYAGVFTAANPDCPQPYNGQ